MKEVFGELYKKTIIINALLGYLSVAKPKNEKLKIKKQKVIDIFGDLQKAYEFSNIREIENTIDEINKQTVDEIKIVNTRKILDKIYRTLAKLIYKENQLTTKRKLIKQTIKKINKSN